MMMDDDWWDGDDGGASIDHMTWYCGFKLVEWFAIYKYEFI